MPNLVGIGLSQVPTNSMLGGLAYQDPEHASIKDLDLKNLSQINSEIADTAVDIFVYDTSKDSDGGAWRKRTTHTSWYNETLNTTTRGSRREFPAVAVIVATADDVIIYDGDDPDLPMWMVFESDEGADAYNTHFLGRSSSHSFSAPITSISMLNGLLSVGKTGSSNFLESFNTIDFIKEDVLHRAQSSFARHSPSSISNRNNAVGFISLSSTGGTVNTAVNDVAMTVLPNAPIDDATGLPIPTIAVATNGGVSVIKDDGTVVDLTYSSTNNISRFIDITSDGKIRYGSRSFSSTYNFFLFVYKNIPSADTSAAPDTRYTYASSGSGNYNLTAVRNGQNSPLADCVDIGDGEFVVSTGSYSNGGQYGIHRIVEYDSFNSSSVPEPLVAIATTSFNTGWMHGDIKGAFLSDTDATNVSGTELWPEGDFADANEWSSAGAEWTISGGTATVSDGDGGYSFLGSSSGTLTNGKKYVLSFTVSNYSGGRLEASQANSSNIQIPFSANGSYSQLINYTGTSGSGLGMYGYGGGAVGFTLDNLYLRELEEEDRSVNNNGLAVYGTVTKSAVATGAELVAYSGFSASNYLRQPYNSDLDFGTGDLSIIFWYKSSDGTAQCILHRGDAADSGGGWGSGPIIQIEFNGTNLAAFLSNSGFSGYDTVGIPIATSANGVWNHYALTRSGGTMNVYFNGSLYGSASSTRTLTNTSARTWIGERPNSTRPATNTSLALFRMGASAPSAEQVKKMYEDEKVLFQENAACTLYGSSDAVTALAYDEVTDRLHVGTSSGRSDFQGLRRINNTTTAVTTAISAHDEFIVEQ